MFDESSFIIYNTYIPGNVYYRLKILGGTGVCI